MDDPESLLSPEILAYYNQGREDERLLHGAGKLELARTQELLQRTLPAPPSVIYDIGGGSGRYATWLAQLGHTVHLIDAAPLHIEQARAASRRQPDTPLASITLGDARYLDVATATETHPGADGVLLLGPLYHLTDADDRQAALREARRITRPGGILLAAAISRFASALDGLVTGALTDPGFRAIVERDLASGQHRNPFGGERDYFTTAYFHHPNDLRAEVESAGWGPCQLLAIEGPAWMIGDFDAWWDDPDRRRILLDLLRTLETEPTLLGASSHIMAVAAAV